MPGDRLPARRRGPIRLRLRLLPAARTTGRRHATPRITRPTGRIVTATGPGVGGNRHIHSTRTGNRALLIERTSGAYVTMSAMTEELRVLSVYEGFFAGGARILHSGVIAALHGRRGQHHEVLSIHRELRRESLRQTMFRDASYLVPGRELPAPRGTQRRGP